MPRLQFTVRWLMIAVAFIAFELAIYPPACAWTIRFAPDLSRVPPSYRSTDLALMLATLNVLALGFWKALAINPSHRVCGAPFCGGGVKRFVLGTNTRA